MFLEGARFWLDRTGVGTVVGVQSVYDRGPTGVS